MSPKRRAVKSAPKVRASEVTSFLWLHDRAEEAARFYVSLIAGSRITHVSRNVDGRSPGAALVVSLDLAGQHFALLNGGSAFDQTPSFSVHVTCRTQGDVDRLWTKLTQGGTESQCGWLTDRYGLSWQVVPERLIELLADPDARRRGRAFDAMMKMGKIDVVALERAADGG